MTAPARTPFWIHFIFSSAFAVILIDLIRRLPVLVLFTHWLLPGRRKLGEEAQKHREMTIEKLRRRKAKENDRDDFYSHIFSQKSSEIGEAFLLANSNTLIVAGSESKLDLPWFRFSHQEVALEWLLVLFRRLLQFSPFFSKCR